MRKQGARTVCTGYSVAHGGLDADIPSVEEGSGGGREGERARGREGETRWASFGEVWVGDLTQSGDETEPAAWAAAVLVHHLDRYLSIYLLEKFVCVQPAASSQQPAAASSHGRVYAATEWLGGFIAGCSEDVQARVKQQSVIQPSSHPAIQSSGPSSVVQSVKRRAVLQVPSGPSTVVQSFKCHPVRRRAPSCPQHHSAPSRRPVPCAWAATVLVNREITRYTQSIHRDPGSPHPHLPANPGLTLELDERGHRARDEPAKQPSSSSASLHHCITASRLHSFTASFLRPSLGPSLGQAELLPSRGCRCASWPRRAQPDALNPPDHGAPFTTAPATNPPTP
ncbi:hypothetical protein PMIN01_05725 [Paraphaeosphaeria minitans]|uniref:Uncharacterized protein n=1 Tax=Paraphaeosphaeria minitans TaxID=565426 RepID=A0A9P6GIX0_9PLEO|nr:hypothetical protein PMIN01_05725 [Paraphaeosphaeria minitans]